LHAAPLVATLAGIVGVKVGGTAMTNGLPSWLEQNVLAIDLITVALAGLSLLAVRLAVALAFDGQAGRKARQICAMPFERSSCYFLRSSRRNDHVRRSSATTFSAHVFRSKHEASQPHGGALAATELVFLGFPLPDACTQPCVLRVGANCISYRSR
jgi:hypothetical protein